MHLTFLGAAGTVTGSRFLVESDDTRILVDCGLFQGLKALRLRNWEPLPVDVASLDAVALTHAHIDHSGYVPALSKQGYRGPVFASQGTRALCGILWPDAGYLQEEAARYANERGFSKHQPALPLYTVADAERSLSLLRPMAFHEPWRVGALELELIPAGHILGAACLRVSDGRRSVVFSGDVGRPDAPLMKPPETLPRHDVLVLESTYGNRRHSRRDPKGHLAAVVREVAGAGGVVLIPSFAVGRAQELIYLLSQARDEGAIPDVPVFVNSPMATSATAIYERFASELRIEPSACARAFDGVRYVRTVEESRALNRREGPMVIISASGMATGGRIVHHLARFAPDERNAIVFAGFQAAGTRGEAIVNGVDQVKIHGEYVPIRARVEQIDSLSAHADYRELCDWLTPVAPAPDRVYLVHGEPAALDGLRRHVRDFLGWDAAIAADGERVEL